MTSSLYGTYALIKLVTEVFIYYMLIKTTLTLNNIYIRNLDTQTKIVNRFSCFNNRWIIFIWVITIFSFLDALGICFLFIHSFYRDVTPINAWFLVIAIFSLVAPLVYLLQFLGLFIFFIY